MSGDTMLDNQSDLKQKLNQLFDRTTLDALTLLITESEREKVEPEALLDWMTASQLARYCSSLMRVVNQQRREL